MLPHLPVNSKCRYYKKQTNQNNITSVEKGFLLFLEQDIIFIGTAVPMAKYL